MGNVPTKESRGRSNTFSSGSSLISDGIHTRSGRRNTTANTSSMPFGDGKKSKRSDEKDKQRESHYKNLIVRFNETVDGGFLAPYGTYKSNLDFDTEIVRNYIVKRQLAPFFTPLQDFDEAWTDDELTTLLYQLPLHSIETAYSEEEEEDDIDNHKIHKSSNYFRRKEQKAKLALMIARVKEQQKQEEEKYMEEKSKLKAEDPNASSYLPSKDLLLKLYRDASECPICFLYYPNHLNVSRCCLQPICTECFVQIKRLEPHPPHDENTLQSDPDALPHTIISEVANCPYCASVDFGVTYDPPWDYKTGIGGTKPKNYTAFANIPEDHDVAISSSPDASSPVSAHLAVKKPKRRVSIAADDPGVITIDMIRPDWELKLTTARNKLARRAATASAIHASNLLIHENNPTQRGSVNSGRQQSSSNGSNFRSAEDRMIEEALRLSLIDEEERKLKVELEKRKKDQVSK